MKKNIIFFTSILSIGLLLGACEKETSSETSGRDGTVVSSIYHVFSDIESGNTITVKITDELKQRLELETTTITIKQK